MYLRNNIWGSHRRDQLRKKCFHFTEGHSSRRLSIFCRRSRSAAVAIGCAANQGTDILIADNIKKAKPGQQDTNILLTKTKMPTSLNQKSWCKLFGWRLLNHRIRRSFWRHRLDLVTLQGLVHCCHLLFVDVYFWCLDTKFPLCQQSDLAATFGGRPHKQARFPVRLTKAQNLWYRGDPFHSKRCLGTKNRCDLCVPHPCCTMSLRILHLCLLRGLGKDGHTLAKHIGFVKTTPSAMYSKSTSKHFCQKQLGSLETSQLAQGRFIASRLSSCPVQSAKCTVARIVRLSSCSVAQPCVLCFLQQPVSWSTFVLHFLHAQ